MTSLWHVSLLWLHLSAAMVWLGGLVFQACVALSTLIRLEPSYEGRRLALRLEVRFRAVMWPAIGVVLFTGLINLLHTWYALASLGMQVSAAFGWVLGCKVLLISMMLILQALQQFAVQPRRLAALQRASASGETGPVDGTRLQRLAALLYGIGVLLGLGVLFCGVLLRAV